MNSIGSQYGGMARAWKKQGPAIGWYKREIAGGAFTPNVVLQAAGSGIPWPVPIQPLRQTARRPPGAWDVTPGSYLQSVYGPEFPALAGDLGVASRVRLIAGMKRELVKRKAGIKVFQKQLKAAKGDEAAKLHALISKYQKRIQELREAIKEKQERKGGRGRWLERAKTRLSTFAGFDMDEDDVDTAGVFDGDSGWWKPVLVLGAIGFMAWYAPKLDAKRRG